MLNCRPDQTPLRILGEKLTADPSRVVLRPFHLAWQSSVSEPSRSAQLVEDLLRLDEDQAELELGLVWKDFSERHWQIGRIFDDRFAEIVHAGNAARAVHAADTDALLRFEAGPEQAVDERGLTGQRR